MSSPAADEDDIRYGLTPKGALALDLTKAIETLTRREIQQLTSDLHSLAEGLAGSLSDFAAGCSLADIIMKLLPKGLDGSD